MQKHGNITATRTAEMMNRSFGRLRGISITKNRISSMAFPSYNKLNIHRRICGSKTLEKLVRRIKWS